jgi:hypothetical protein
MKWTVWALIVSLLGRVCCAIYQGPRNEFFNLLNLVMVIVMGIFILKDDSTFKDYYQCLSTSICQTCAEQGMGGLGCLMPFTVLCGINFIFDILFKSRQVNMMPYGIFMSASILAEAVGAYFGWTIYKFVRDNGMGQSPDMEMNSGGLGGMQGGFLSGGGGGYAQAPAQPQQGGGEAPTSASQGEAAGGNFVPFGGSGQRLGS